MLKQKKVLLKEDPGEKEIKALYDMLLFSEGNPMINVNLEQLQPVEAEINSPPSLIKGCHPCYSAGLQGGRL